MAEIVLTPGQRAAVESRGCALLVAAAAGSGKTRVLIDRVLDQVIREGRHVDEFLLITFTQAAAAELREAAGGAEPPPCRRPGELPSAAAASAASIWRRSPRSTASARRSCGTMPTFWSCPPISALQTSRRQPPCGSAPCAPFSRRPYADPSPAVRAALDLPGAGRDDRALQELIVRVYTNLQCYPDPAATADRWEVMLDVTDCTDPARRSGASGCCGSCSAARRAMRPCWRRALALAEENEAVSAYVPVLQANLLLLEALASAGSWEALRASRRISAVSAIRKCADPETQERIKRLRTDTVARVRRRLEPFSLQPDETLRELSGSAEALRGLLALTRAFSARFAAEKSRRHLLDYNDLEHFALRLLDGPLRRADGGRPRGGRALRRNFVDEYQDTNRVQEAIYSAISRSCRLCWRREAVHLPLPSGRPDHFSGKNTARLRRSLPQESRAASCFRIPCSHAEILSAANDVFRLTMTERTGGLVHGDAGGCAPTGHSRTWVSLPWSCMPSTTARPGRSAAGPRGG